MNDNLALHLPRTAAEHGQSPALRLDDTVLTYAQLDDTTARVAGLLRERGVRPGDRVGVMLPNVPEFAFAYYGVLRAGGCRGADEHAPQGARGRVLPRRLRGQAPVRLARVCRPGAAAARTRPGPSA